MLSRRRFLAGLAAAISLNGARAGGVASTASPLRLSPSQRQWLLQALPARDRAFDPLARLIVVPAAPGPGARPAGRGADVRATRPSLAYASALLDTAEDWRVDRARQILGSVLSLQDVDPESKTYGLWSRYLEEPVTSMPPQAWLEVGHGVMSLLTIWATHRDVLGQALQNRVGDALLHTARSFERREVPPSQTHAAVLCTGVILVSAQELRLADLRERAKGQLRHLHESVVHEAAFADFNSPVHTVMAIQELARLRWLVRDGRDQTFLTALHDRMWAHAAAHFHAPTQQWAGPHSAAESTNLADQPATLAFLHQAAGPELSWPKANPMTLSAEAYRLPLHCPRKSAKFFTRLNAPRQVTEVFLRPRPPIDGSKNPLLGTTWLHPNFTLGSSNRGDLSSPRRPLLAYWGTAQAPRSLRVRYLKDDDDFGSALLFTTQHEGHVLGAVVFCTDATGPGSLPGAAPAAALRARDLRLSFQFEGELGNCTVRRVGEEDYTLLIADDPVRWVLRLVAGRFGEAPLAWTGPALKLADKAEVVTHSGPERAFDLAKMGETFFCFTLSAWPLEAKQLPPSPQIRREPGRLRARWVIGGKTHDLVVPTVSSTFAAMNDAFRGQVSG